MANEVDEATVQALLNYSRAKIASGDRDEALACLIQAISLTRGEEAVIGVLTASKERAEKERREAEAAAIAEANRHQSTLDEAIRASMELLNTPSLLLERDDGSEQILCDAFEDGSSVICKRCGGLVKRLRWDAHCELWCSAISEENS